MEKLLNWLEAIDRYGIASVILVAVGFGSWYVLRRLFAKDGGILTKVADRHIDYLDKTEQYTGELTESNRRLASAAETAHEAMLVRNEQFAALLDSREGLHRAAGHACDVLALVSEKLGVDASIPIGHIRREIGTTT